MTHSITHSSIILDAVGALSSFSLSKLIWKKYQTYAIPKLEEASIEIRESLIYINELSPHEALEELKDIQTISKYLARFKKLIEKENNNKFMNLKKAYLEFCDAIDLLCERLEEISYANDSFIASIANEIDWNSKQDDHWDSY